jgi:hypothetical protein
VIVEVLSDSIAKTDQGLKKEIYQEIFRTPEYFWFDPDSLELQGFALVQGQYQDMQPNQEGRPWSEQLQLFQGFRILTCAFSREQVSYCSVPPSRLSMNSNSVRSQRICWLSIAPGLETCRVTNCPFTLMQQPMQQPIQCGQTFQFEFINLLQLCIAWNLNPRLLTEVSLATSNRVCVLNHISPK